MNKSSLGIIGLLLLVACGSESGSSDPSASSPPSPDDAVVESPRGDALGAPVVTALGDDGAIKLSWKAVAGASGYDVARATASGGEVFVAHVDGGAAFVDTDVTLETTYFYTVTAKSGDGKSATSSEVSAAAFSFDALHMRHNAQVLRGAATGANGVLVAVGDGMRVIRSTDGGASWTDVRVAGGVGTLDAIAYGGGKFVAVGNRGQIFTSADGLAWQGAQSGVTANLRGIAYGGKTTGRFVAIGDASTIVTSVDGVTWTAVTNNLHHTVNSSFDYRLKSIAYGDATALDYFVIVASDANGNAGYAFYVDGSSDLGTWAPSPAGNLGFLSTTTIAGVTFGKFQGGGAAMPAFHMVGANGFWAHAEQYSAGSLSFGTVTAGSTSDNWNAIAFDGNDTLAIFSDATNVMTCSITSSCKAGMNGWTLQTSPAASGYTAATPTADGKLIGVAADELVVGAAAGADFAEMHRSSPSYTHLLTEHLAGVGDHIVVAGSYGGRYLWSSDGGEHFASAATPSNATLWSAKAIGGKLFMVGTSSTIMSSDTGATGTWNVASVMPTNEKLHDIASSGSLAIAVGEGGAFTSPDATTWTHQTGAGHPIARIEWEGTTFVATTFDGHIMTTTDGVAWKDALYDDAPGMSFEGLALDGEMIVATGRNGHVWVSTDHAKTFVPHHIADAPDLVGVARYSGHWVAGGSKQHPQLWTSEDAITWKRRTPIPSMTYSVDVAAGKLFVVGQFGAIYSTPKR